MARRTKQHGRQPTRSISEMRTHLPSGDTHERCAIPSLSAGRYTSRSSARLSVAVATPIAVVVPTAAPVLLSENTTC
jgi:hypothetical protein